MTSYFWYFWKIQQNEIFCSTLELWWWVINKSTAWPSAQCWPAGRVKSHIGRCREFLLLSPPALTDVCGVWVKVLWRCNKQTSGWSHVWGQHWMDDGNPTILQFTVRSLPVYSSSPGETRDNQNSNGCHGDCHHCQVPAFTVALPGDDKTG